jgi:hypothetical protein
MLLANRQIPFLDYLSHSAAFSPLLVFSVASRADVCGMIRASGVVDASDRA